MNKKLSVMLKTSIEVMIILSLLTIIFLVKSGTQIKEEDFLSKFEEVIIIVSPGESSWTIQSRLTPNDDVRKVLYYVGQINDRPMGEIKACEELVFLRER